MPPVRKYGNENASLDIQRTIKSITANLQIDYITEYYKGETTAEFMEQGLISDGVHFTEERMRTVIKKALERMGRREKIRDNTEKIDRKKVWPDCCWVCGEKGRDCRTYGHKDIEMCNRCGKEGHNTNKQTHKSMTSKNQ